MSPFNQLLRELDGRDAYDLLSVPRSATSTQINKAYKTLALACHPDRASGTNAENAKTAFQRLNAAHTILFRHRREYDKVSASSHGQNHPGKDSDPPPNTSGDRGRGAWGRHGEPYRPEKTGPHPDARGSEVSRRHDESHRSDRSRPSSAGRGNGVWGRRGEPYRPEKTEPPPDARGGGASGRHDESYRFDRSRPSADGRESGAWGRRRSEPYRSRNFSDGRGTKFSPTVPDLSADKATDRRMRRFGALVFISSAPFWLYGLFIPVYLTLTQFDVLVLEGRGGVGSGSPEASRDAAIGLIAIGVVASVVLISKAFTTLWSFVDTTIGSTLDLGFTLLVIMAALWGLSATIWKIFDPQLWVINGGFPSRGWLLFFP